MAETLLDACILAPPAPRSGLMVRLPAGRLANVPAGQIGPPSNRQPC